MELYGTIYISGFDTHTIPAYLILNIYSSKCTLCTTDVMVCLSVPVVLQTDESASECFCLCCPPLTNSSNTVATGQYLISWRRYTITQRPPLPPPPHSLPPLPPCWWNVRAITWTVWMISCRQSSGPDSPLTTSTLTLPHVILESVPLYIHAGQFTHLQCTSHPVCVY